LVTFKERNGKEGRKIRKGKMVLGLNNQEMFKQTRGTTAEREGIQ